MPRFRLCPCCDDDPAIMSQVSELPLEPLGKDSMYSMRPSSMVFKNQKNNPLAASNNKISNNNNMDRKTLEEKYAILESKMKDYESIEESAVDEMGPMLLDFLEDLRTNPKRYIKSTNEAVAALATARLLVVDVEEDIKNSTKTIKEEDDSVKDSMIYTSAPNTNASTSAMVSGKKEGNSLTNSRGANPLKRDRGPNALSSTRNGPVGTVSETWASRLADIVPTQGGMKEVVNQDGTKVLKIKPKWPEWLVDEQFEVCKHTKYGPRYRVLRLTEFHILGIRGGSEITKSYAYLEVDQVYTKSSMNGIVVVLVFKDGRCFHYASKMAAHIVQQITTRMKVRASLESSTFSVPVSHIVQNYGRASLMEARPSMAPNMENINFSVDAVRQIIDSISEENSKSGSSNVIGFAKTLKDNILKNHASDASSTGIRQSLKLTPNGSSRASLAVTVGAAINVVGNLITGKKPKQIDIEQWAKRIMAIQANSPEAVVQASINKILFNPDTPEGSTRKHFIDTFHASSFPNGATVAVRQWIEGMHGYLLGQRGVELTNSLSDAEMTKPVPGLETIYGSTVAPTQPTRPGAPPASYAGKKKPETMTLSEVDENALTSTSYVAFVCVEESVYLPLQSKILQLLPSSTPEEVELEAKLAERFRRLSTRSQTELGIPATHVSSLQWSSAQFELAGIERNPTPSTRLQAVVRTAKAIYAEFNKEVVPRIMKQKQKEAEEKIKAGNRKSYRQSARLAAPQEEDKADQVMLGADDLVPIFIFVVCRAGLQTPLRNKDLLWNLCHPDQLYGEPGYYLTQYESAVAYIEDLDDDLVIDL